MKFVYFNKPIHIRLKNSTKPHHMVNTDRFDIKIEKSIITVTSDGFKTIIPIHNVSSIVVYEDKTKIDG